jgi:hypothetical protein
MGVVFTLSGSLCGSLGAPPLAAAVGPFGFARTDYLLESHLPGLDSVAIGDVDGGNGPDVVVLSYTGGGAVGVVNVLLNQGDGTFAAPLAFDACAGAKSIVIGQFNPGTDSHPDVAMMCGGSTLIGRMRGDGTGNFAPVQTVDVGYTGAGAGTGSPHVALIEMLRSGAMNGPTLAYAGYMAGIGRFTLCFFGALQLETDLDGAGGQAPYCNIHVDGLGHIDEYGPLSADLTVGPYQVVPGEPVARDEAISFGEVPAFMSVTAYNPQFVAQWGYGIRPSGATGAAIALADVDNDGQNDILMGNDSLIADYVPGWPLSAAPDHSFASIPFLYDMVTGDFDGDGKVDIAALGDDDNADADVTLAIHRGAGDGTFAPYARFTTRGSAGANYLQVVATGDLDGDGRPDLVTVGELDRYASVLLNRSPLFADGFESGDSLRWSASFPP